MIEKSKAFLSLYGTKEWSYGNEAGINYIKVVLVKKKWVNKCLAEQLRRDF